MYKKKIPSASRLSLSATAHRLKKSRLVPSWYALENYLAVFEYIFSCAPWNSGLQGGYPGSILAPVELITN